MIIYYFNDFGAFGEIQISQMFNQLPQQQQELISGTKLLSRKREIAISYIMLAYAIENDKTDIVSDNLSIREFRLPIVSSAWQTTFNFQLSTFNFTFASHGKPYLTNHEDIFFNISHCRDAIVTAVSNKEIGIDVEGHRRFSDSLLNRAFNEEEQTLVLNATVPEMEFARIWTRKEAFFKWTGTGILIDHIKSVEEDAKTAGCSIKTMLVEPASGSPFNLSIASAI